MIPFPAASVGSRRGFNPASLLPYVWLDFTDSSRITLNSGNVASISNKGSYGGAFAQANATYQPIWKNPSTGFSSQESAEFNTRYLTQSGHTGIAALTEYLVFRINAGVPGGTQFTTSYGGYNVGSDAISVGINNNSTSWHFLGPTYKGATSNGYAINKNYRRAFRVDATSAYQFGNPVRDIVNGSAVTTAAGSSTAPGTVGAGVWSIGSNTDNAFPFYGEIHHWFVFNRLLTDDELAALDGWVTTNFTGGSWG